MRQLLAAALIFCANVASADPSGAYRVAGLVTSTGQSYSGTVTVSLAGEIYRIIWLIDGREIRGTALGGAFDQGSLTVGPAHPEDLMLAIGFLDGELTGSATMFLQRSGTYEGYLALEGDTAARQETWTPME